MDWIAYYSFLKLWSCQATKSASASLRGCVYLKAIPRVAASFNTENLISLETMDFCQISLL